MPNRRNVLGLLIASIGLMLSGIAIWILFSTFVADRVRHGVGDSAIPVAVDFEAPQLILRDIDNNQFSLADYAGQVVLANLWATWCPPCEEEMPVFQSFYEKHRKDGFVVIAIEQGDPSEEVRSFVQAHRLTFPVWLDPTQQAITQTFQTARLPSSYVVDRYNRVRLMWYGAINEDSLEKYVSPIIKEKH